MERKMAQHTEREIMEVHQRLYAFDLRVLARPAPPVNVSTLQDTIESLRADLDTIQEARVLEFEAPSAEPIEDIVLAALFSTTAVPPHPLREHAKRCRG